MYEAAKIRSGDWVIFAHALDVTFLTLCKCEAPFIFILHYYLPYYYLASAVNLQ